MSEMHVYSCGCRELGRFARYCSRHSAAKPPDDQAKPTPLRNGVGRFRWDPVSGELEKEPSR